MNNYVVLYIEPDSLSTNPPLAFTCQADDADHAEEQCENAYPDCTVVWTGMGMNVEETLQDYWNNAVGGEIKQPHCPYCDSTKLVATGNLVWDINKQEWALVDVLDDITCESCNQEFKYSSWKEVVYGKHLD